MIIFSAFLIGFTKRSFADVKSALDSTLKQAPAMLKRLTKNLPE